MAKEMLKAWNLEDGVGMVKPGTLAKLNKKALKMMKKMQKKEKPVLIEKAIRFVGRHPLYDIDRVYSGYAYERIFDKKEEKVMNKKLEEMAVKALVRDCEDNADALSNSIVAFNDGAVCGKINRKYGHDYCIDHAEESDLLSLRLTKMSMLGYIDVDTFLATYDNFEDACKAAETRERLAYVNEKMSLDTKLNEIIDWAHTQPSEEHQEEFWKQCHKKMQKYSADYDKEPVVWYVKNSDRIRQKAMKILIKNACHNVGDILDVCYDTDNKIGNVKEQPHYQHFCNICDQIDNVLNMLNSYK